MNYNKIYNNLITRAREQKLTGYKETHHIVPRCLGGTDSQENLVDLTFEEHFMAHILLVKIYPDNYQLIFAVNRMCSGHKGRRTTRKLYGWLRRKFIQTVSERQTGKGNSQFGKYWITNGEEVARINKEETIPVGWVRGKNLKKCISCDSFASSKTATMCTKCRKIKNYKNGIKNSKFFAGTGPASYNGRCFITNGSIDKLIPLTVKIPDGWKKGRSQNKRKL